MEEMVKPANTIELETYSPEKLRGIKNLLEFQVKRGSPIYFKMNIDGHEIIERTSDIKLFDEYKGLLGSGKELAIYVYNTAHTTRYRMMRRFDISNPPKEEIEVKVPPVPQNLNGLDMQSQVKEGFARERQDWEKDQQIKELSKEKDALKVQLTDAEVYIDQLEQSLSEKAEKGGEFKTLLMNTLQGLIAHNPKLAEKVGGALDGLAGTTPNKEESSAKEEEASFKKKEVFELSQEEQLYVQNLREVTKKLNAEQLTMLMNIMSYLVDNSKDIDPIAELLDVKEESNNTKK